MEQLSFNFDKVCPRCNSSVWMNLPGIEPHTDYDYTRCIEALRREDKISSKQLQDWYKFAQDHEGQEFIDEFDRIVDEAIQARAEDEACKDAYRDLFGEAA
jgi:hypothetical protein